MRLVNLALWLGIVFVALLPLLRRRPPSDSRSAVASDELVKDPVCGTYVVRSRAVTRGTAAGPAYFCSAECAGRFGG